MYLSSAEEDEDESEQELRGCQYLASDEEASHTSSNEFSSPSDEEGAEGEGLGSSGSYVGYSLRQLKLHLLAELNEWYEPTSKPFKV